MYGSIWKELQLFTTTQKQVSELASKLERLNFFYLFYSEWRKENQSKSSTDNSSGERCYRWGSLRWDGLILLFSDGYCTTSKRCLSIFMVRIKLLAINRDNSISVFCHYFTSLKYDLWLQNKYNEICLLSKHPLGWAFLHNLLRDYCFVQLKLVKPVILGTVLTLLLSTMASEQLWLLQTIAFVWVTGDVICRNSEAKIWNLVYRASVLWLSTLF